MSRKCNPRLVSWVLAIGGLVFLSPSVCRAVDPASGSVSLSAGVTYSNFTWKFLIDPLQVEGFQLSVSYDPLRAQFTDLAFLNGYTQETPPMIDESNGMIHGIHGQNSNPPTGEVDVVELSFTDLNAALNPNTASFRVFADPAFNDFVRVIDTDEPGGPIIRIFGPGQPDGPVIGATGNSIPEPGTFVLGGIALIGLLAFAVRQRRGAR